MKKIYIWLIIIFIFAISFFTVFEKSYEYYRVRLSQNILISSLESTFLYVVMGLFLLILPAILTFYFYHEKNRKMGLIAGSLLYAPLILLCSYFGSVLYLGSLFFPLEGMEGFGVIGFIPIVIIIEFIVCGYLLR